MKANKMNYSQKVKFVERLGMSVEDGLAFTVCGGQLVDGRKAPPHIVKLNGCTVEEVVRELRAVK